MKKIDFKAVGDGTLVNLAASIIFGFATGYLFGTGDNLLPVFLIIGLAFIALGGYVAAKIASDFKLYNATLVGVVGILVGLPFYSSYPVWYTVLSIILMPPSAYLGGKFAFKNITS